MRLAEIVDRKGLALVENILDSATITLLGEALSIAPTISLCAHWRLPISAKQTNRFIAAQRDVRQHLPANQN